MKPTIHFAHANGFPASTYQKLFQNLSDHYHIASIDTMGHNSHYPIQDNWPHLVDELVDYLRKTYRDPVYGVGHSLGGVLTFMAAERYPELFKAIVILDSPIYGWFKCMGIKLAKHLHFIDRVTPGTNTRFRRRYFPNAVEAREHFRRKKLFKYFDEDCLNDYIQYGMVDYEMGLQLKFKREVEYQIYRTLPHHLYQFNRPLKVPLGFMYGKQSAVIKSQDIRYFKKRYHAHMCEVSGTHLFPFEHPATTGQNLVRLLEELNNKTP